MTNCGDNAFVPLIPDGPCNKNILELKEAFRRKYKSSPLFVTRAPGRVNLIGEHIDYCGYAVLPMALEQDVLIAFSPNDSTELEICSADPTYEDFKCSSTNVEVDISQPKWYNYVLCGFLGIAEHFKLQKPCGIKMCVEGTIPPSAGLSSSSALVCAAALATLHANGLTMGRKELAALCAHSEHYIGTEGGGMDQAISFLAEQGTAKLIEFNPLRTTDVKLPGQAAFVIANSCTDVNKAATSDFNTRVVECRLAAQVLAKKAGLEWRQIRKLGDIQKELMVPLVHMAQLIVDTFHPAPYTKKEVCDLLEVTSEELDECSLSANTLDVEKFYLTQRATHVYTEANRVVEFKKICDEASSDSLKRLGDLMNSSHASCRDLYDCSHTNLDELVEAAIQAGALGSRLTGAGWGGCTVSLVPTEKISEFLEKLKKTYYEKSPKRNASIEKSVFPTQPGGGALIYKL